MFRIKICGVTSIGDALAAVDAGADAIGLNFFQGSPRYVGIPVAEKISAELGADVHKVGVFVNAAAATIRETSTFAGLHYVQLHGDERPEFLQELAADVPIIRVCRLDAGGLSAVAADVAACQSASRVGPAAVLIDAAAPGMYGGSGVAVDWPQLADYRRWLGDVPLILAGGLRPENVAKAIRAVRPQAIDVSSGVELSPGKKDPAKVRDFVAAAQAAFSE